MLKIENLTFDYPDGTRALHEITVDIPPEHTFAILGQSGSGKTTLLNCIARFLIPQSGSILLNGEDIQSLPRAAFRSRVGVVFQQLNLFPHMTLLDNMTLAPIKVQRRSRLEADQAAMEMLERLGIAGFGDSYPGQVSGGQAQRAAIARGLMMRPDYMLLDEPTSALDAKTTDEFADWLRELNADTSFVVVTHDLRFARRAAEHGIAMREGRVTCQGQLAELVADIEKGASDHD